MDTGLVAAAAAAAVLGLRRFERVVVGGRGRACLALALAGWLGMKRGEWRRGVDTGCRIVGGESGGELVVGDRMMVEVGRVVAAAAAAGRRGNRLMVSIRCLEAAGGVTVEEVDAVPEGRSVVLNDQLESRRLNCLFPADAGRRLSVGGGELIVAVDVLSGEGRMRTGQVVVPADEGMRCIVLVAVVEVVASALAESDGGG